MTQDHCILGLTMMKLTVEIYPSSSKVIYQQCALALCLHSHALHPKHFPQTTRITRCMGNLVAWNLLHIHNLQRINPSHVRNSRGLMWLPSSGQNILLTNLLVYGKVSQKWWEDFHLISSQHVGSQKVFGYPWALFQCHHHTRIILSNQLSYKQIEVDCK